MTRLSAIPRVSWRAARFEGRRPYLPGAAIQQLAD